MEIYQSNGWLLILSELDNHIWCLPAFSLGPLQFDQFSRKNYVRLRNTSYSENLSSPIFEFRRCSRANPSVLCPLPDYEVGKMSQNIDIHDEECPKKTKVPIFSRPRGVYGEGARKNGDFCFFLKSLFYFNPSLTTSYTSQGQHVVTPSLSPITTPPKSKIFLGRPWVNHQIWLHNDILRIGILKYVKI